jgi:hypothetical protein
MVGNARRSGLKSISKRARATCCHQRLRPSPEYSEYMSWRGIQYFSGGALSMFTGHSLAVGVKDRCSGRISQRRSTGSGRRGALWALSLCALETPPARLRAQAVPPPRRRPHGGGAILELCTLATTPVPPARVYADVMKPRRRLSFNPRAPSPHLCPPEQHGRASPRGRRREPVGHRGHRVPTSTSRLNRPIARLRPPLLRLPHSPLAESRLRRPAVLSPARLAYAADVFFRESGSSGGNKGDRSCATAWLGGLRNRSCAGCSIEGLATHLRLSRALATAPSDAMFCLTYRPTGTRCL